MTRYLLILLTLIAFIPNISFAQLSLEQEKRLEDLEEKARVLETWEQEKSIQDQKLLELSEQEKGWQARESVKELSTEKNPDENIGRFQAVRMNNSTIMILDTSEGHLWVWISQPDQSGKSAEFLIYQGQVIPGSKMGEIINRTFNK